MKTNWVESIVGNKSELKRFSLQVSIILSVLALFSYLLLDSQISQFFAPDEFYIFRRVNRHLTDVGESVHFFILSLIIYLCSLLILKFKPDWLSLNEMKVKKIEFAKKWGSCFFICLLTSGIAVHLLKFLVGRQRPHKSELFLHDVFTNFTTHWHYHSFPSGHTQTLFVAAVFLSWLMPSKTKWIFALAFLFSFTRIPTHQHFLSDVFMGALVGTLVSLWTLYILNPKTKNQN